MYPHPFRSNARLYQLFQPFELLASRLLLRRNTKQEAVGIEIMNTLAALDRERDQDLFETVTEEEIIYLWRSIKGRGLSEDEAWQAVVTGIALDMAFAKTKSCKQIEH